MAVLLPEPERPVTTTRRSSFIRCWGPVRCSRGFRRAPLLRCPQTPSAKTSASALGLRPLLRLTYSRGLRGLPPREISTVSLRLSGAAALAGGDLVVEALGEGERAVPAARAGEGVARRGLDQHRHAATGAG